MSARFTDESEDDHSRMVRVCRISRLRMHAIPAQTTKNPTRNVPARIVRTAACWTMSRMVMVSCASARGYALGLTSAMASVVTAAGEGRLVRMDQTKVLGSFPVDRRRFDPHPRERRVFFAGHARLTRALLKTHVKLHCLLLAQLRGDRGRRLSSGLGGGWAWT